MLVKKIIYYETRNPNIIGCKSQLVYVADRPKQIRKSIDNDFAIV